MTFYTTYKPLPPEILADALEPPPRKPDRIICATPLTRKRRMPEPKYQPNDDEEPRIEWYERDWGNGPQYGVWLDGEAHCETREEAEAEVQRVAIAIADRVHGAELAALREALHELVDAVTRACDEGTRVGDALVAAEAVLEGESDHGS